MNWKQQREGGHRWVIRGAAALTRSLPRPVLRFLLSGVCAYYFLLKTQARRASSDFLRRVLGRAPSWREQWRHFWFFAQVILDRMLILASDEPPLSVQVEGLDELIAAVDQGRGVILLGSHLGSFEAPRLIERWQDRGLTVHPMIDRAHSGQINAVLEAARPELAMRVIDAADGMMALVRAGEVLESGGLVGILGDRAQPGERTCAVPVLGEEVQLPLTPYLLALSSGAPIVSFFGIFDGRRSYRVQFRRFWPGGEVDRAGRSEVLEAMAHRYAERLSEQARRTPYNWFNLYHYWTSP